MLKTLAISVLLLTGLLMPASIRAQEQVCTQVYGGGVVCGVKHEVVETGLGENLALVGALSLVASGVLLFLAKRNKNLAPQN